MSLVVDASVVVAALIDSGPVGRWAETILVKQSLCAPHLMPVEAANILRRATIGRDISVDMATVCHGDLTNLQVELFPYYPFALRAWELHPNITLYDAWYVALAESIGSKLATLDTRLARSPGPVCDFMLPPEGRPEP